MSDEVEARDQAPAVYINLVAAYITLVQMRDYLRFLAKVSEPGSDDDQEALFHPRALAWGFASMASDLSEVADAVRWSADACQVAGDQ